MTDPRLLALTAHGGCLQRAAALYEIPLPQWMDLSTGINPHGWTVGAIPQTVFARLPEEEDGLTAVMRGYFGISLGISFGTCDVLAVAGSQSAIQALPWMRERGRVAVRVPTYSEHATAWRKAGHDVVAIDMSSDEHAEVDSLLDEVDVLVVVNPNNPTGETLPADLLLQWHERLSRRGGWLVVDEAFVDADPSASVARHAGKHLIVLRSLGKFWGLAGVRMGFVLAEGALLDRLRERLGPWQVNNPARWIARAALTDEAWMTKARIRLHEDGARLHVLLAAHGLLSRGGCPLFRWIPTQNVALLFDAFARRGILIRALPHAGGVRLGLPGPEVEWTRLEAVLGDVMPGARI
jgi:cobalamin biosynthesis protein CobC